MSERIEDVYEEIIELLKYLKEDENMTSLCIVG